ncbi:MAG TPA: LuxR family transcriptional regulator [Micromonosporaceae bacterium]|nr:LuxR family transcriptional regulator [Micromonosporaceae bacterium]
MSGADPSARWRAPTRARWAHPTVAVQCPRRLVREALVNWLTRTGLRVVGQVADIATLPALCGRRRPELVIVDAGADVPAVLGPLSALRARYPAVRVLVIYDAVSPADVAQAHRSGLDTLLPSSVGLQSFLLELQRRGMRTGAGPPTGRLVDQDLTAQELQVLTLLSSGCTVRDIAAKLHVGANAVESIKRRIYAKLRVTSQSHAVARAVSLGLVDAQEPPVPASSLGGQPHLTAREFDILRSIAMGHSVRQTAQLLVIGEKTVGNLQSRLFLKLGTRNRAEAIRAAYGLGLLDLVVDGVQRTGRA